jgi:tetratricopeptide (TPR) repeat protein
MWGLSVTRRFARGVAAAVLLAGVMPLRTPAQQPAVPSSREIASAYARSFELERAQRFDEAIRALGPVYRAYPTGYTVNLRMAYLFYRNGNHVNAITHYETAGSAAPFSLEPKLGRLLPLLAQERWAEAEALAYQVLSGDHFNYYANLRLLVALRAQRKLDAALQVALKMVTAYPTDGDFLVELALVRDARGETAEARRLFGEILILYPESTIAKQYLRDRPPSGGR